MSEVAAPSPRTRRAVVIALVAVVAVVVMALLWLLVLRPLLADPQAEAEPTEVLTLEPAAAAGDNPFTETVTAREIAAHAGFAETIVARTIALTQEAAADPLTGTLGVVGTTPGLYGGSSQVSICDPDALVAYLGDDPAKAAAFAGVLSIAPEGIPDLVASLTSVVLTADTLVTNHGFADGAATSHQSVLQAGTAVMINGLGVPTVRCECGNPMLAPALSGAVGATETAGTGWEGLDLDRVVTVTAVATEVSAFTVADLQTGALVEQPAGPSRAAPVYIATSSNHAEIRWEPDAPPASGTIQTSSDGVQWSVALETTPMIDVATGDGLAVAVGLDDEFEGAIHTSTDGVTWSPAIHVIDPLTAVAYGDGTWIAVGDRSFAEESGPGDASSGAIYRSNDGESWQRVAITDPYENGELADSGEFLHQAMTSVGYGDGRWVATATECAYRTCMRVLFTSTDTITWTRMALDDRVVLIDIAHNGQEWGFVGGEPTPNPRDNSEIDFPIGAAGTSADAITWNLGPTRPDRLVLTGLNPGNDEWLAVDAYTPRTTDDPPPAGGVYRSSDLQTWELIGTAAEWTTSVALLHSTTTAVPPPPAPATAEPTEPPLQTASVRIMTEALVLLDPDGSTVQTFPYAEPAADALDTLTGIFGDGAAEFTAGDDICTQDTTTTSWAGLHVMHPGTQPDAPGWWVYLAADAPAHEVTVGGPDGVIPGQRFDAVLADHPQAPTRSFSHEGTTHDYVYLDVVTRETEWGPDNLAVEVGAHDGTVTALGAPVRYEGDC